MVSSNVLSTPPKHLFGCLIQIKSIKSPYFFWVKSSNVDHVDHVLSWMIPHQVAPKSLPRSPAHAFHRRGDSSTSWGISQPPGFHYTAIPMFISWNHHDITMKSPWNHHEITMKSPWNHHETTMKSPWSDHWGGRNDPGRRGSSAKLAQWKCPLRWLGNPPNSWRVELEKA